MLQESKHGIRSWMIHFWWVLRHRLWHLSVWQLFYLFVISIFRPGLYDKAVHDDTDVVIEGFPRSANTFLVHALELAVNGNIRIAHHLHDPCQIRCAVRRRIPCFVIVRDPLDAVVSWKLKAPYMDAELMLRVYVTFYRYAIQFEQSVFFLHYSDVVSCPTAVISEIMQRNVLKIHFDLTTITEAQIFHSIDERKRTRNEMLDNSFDLSVARPSEAKEKFKHALRHDIAEHETDQLSEATELYKRLKLLCINIRQESINNIGGI